MEERLISFETSKLAKENYFNEPCLSFYGKNKLNANFDLYDCSNRCKEHLNENNPISISVPTQALLKKWLREKHKKHIVVNITISEHWYFEIYNLDAKRNHEINGYDHYLFKTYEESLEKALQEALKLIKG